MSLFERSGIILEKGEEVVKRGKCKGKVPKEMGMRIKVGFRPDFTLPVVKKREWEDVEGEMVLTTKRLIVIGEKGHIRKSVIPFLNLDLKCIKAVSTKKPLVGKERLLLSMDLGTERLETTEMEVENASEWSSVIRKLIEAAS
jgi:hypothetical protein